MVVATGVTLLLVPLVTVPTLLSMVPVPPVNENARVALPPAVTIAGVAVKLAMAGVECTVSVAALLMTLPAELLTVTVKVVPLSVAATVAGVV